MDGDGNYLNERADKRVWLKWMELRIHEDVEAIDVGTGFIPMYNDLKALFKDVLGKDYSKDQYIKQFTLRIPENISKINRILEIYNGLGSGVPDILFRILKEQRTRLEILKNKKGEYISPLAF
jgi:phosphoenolpyruvate carboxykinase (GTP)